MNVIIDFFAEYKSIVVIGHAVSAAIGLGAATVSDVLFFRFLEDGNITEEETPVLDIMTKIMWVALSLLILTGIMLFLSNPVGYVVSSKFIVKMFIVAVITINGIVMTKYLHKNMQKLTFTNKYHKAVKKVAFASGAISITSWYLSFLLGSIRSIPFDVATGIVMYLTAITIGMFVSQLMYYHYQQKFLQKQKNET